MLTLLFTIEAKYLTCAQKNTKADRQTLVEVRESNKLSQRFDTSLSKHPFGKDYGSSLRAYCRYMTWAILFKQEYRSKELVLWLLIR